VVTGIWWLRDTEQTLQLQALLCTTMACLVGHVLQLRVLMTQNGANLGRLLLLLQTSVLPALVLLLGAILLHSTST